MYYSRASPNNTNKTIKVDINNFINTILNSIRICYMLVRVIDKKRIENKLEEGYFRILEKIIYYLVTLIEPKKISINKF